MENPLLTKDMEDIQLIVFRLGSEEYAVPIACVQEIIMRQNATRIPRSPGHVEGVINLRGRIIPIIDGRTKFSLDVNKDDKESEKRIIILEVNAETIGLIVDAVSEVIHLKTNDIEPPPIDHDVDSDFLWGIGKFADRLLILVDPQKFLSMSECSDLENIVKMASAIKQEKEQVSVTSRTRAEV